MSFEQKDDQLIADYLKGILSDTERKQVEERMQRDIDFKKELHIQEGLKVSLSEEGWVDWDHSDHQEDINALKKIRRSDEVMHLESTITQVADGYFKKQAPKDKSRFLNYGIRIAAAAAICIFIFKIFNVNPSASDLYNTYSNWDNDLLSTIEQSDLKDHKQEVESLFKAKKYQEAITLFENSLEQNPSEDVHSLMYLGASYLELGNYNKALQSFDQLLRLETLDSNRAYWFKAMLYLKQEDKNAAKEQLKIITSHPEYYNYTLAKELLEEL